eukprot:4081203-Pyramimonas_sp.AAC.1
MGGGRLGGRSRRRRGRDPGEAGDCSPDSALEGLNTARLVQDRGGDHPSGPGRFLLDLPGVARRHRAWNAWFAD